MRPLALTPFIVVTMVSAADAAGGITAVDGDTVRIDGETVRVIGLDTPELRGKCASEKSRARAARRRLADLLEGSGLHVLFSGRRDRYRRPLARIVVGGRDVADVMIAEGHARPYDGGRRAPWCLRLPEPRP